MSYSSVRSDHGSIRSLLERLNAHSFGDGPFSDGPPGEAISTNHFRADPLQVLREARLKIAGHASSSDKMADADAGTDEFMAGVRNVFAAADNARAPWNEEQIHTVVLPPDKFSSPDHAAKGVTEAAAVVIDTEFETISPRPALLGRSRLLSTGVVGAALMAMLGTGMIGDFPGTDQEPRAKFDQALAEEPAAAPVVDGVGRFTVPAIRLAEFEPAMADAGFPILSSVKTTRLDTKAGGEVALPIKLGPALGTGEVAAIVLRGLPSGYSVVGGVAGDDSWVVSPDALDTARILVPPAGAGEVSVTAELFDMSAQLVGSPRFVLDVRTTERSRELDPERARALLARGQGLLQAGDIAGARLLFEAAAESGVAEGAYALGESFDPGQLTARGVFGLTGDAARARFWYAHASEQGIEAARERLAALDAGN